MGPILHELFLGHITSRMVEDLEENNLMDIQLI